MGLLKELSQEEKGIALAIAKGLEQKYRGADNCISSTVLLDRLEANNNIKITGATFRKMVHWLKVSQRLPVIATSNGYFWATSNSEIEKNIQSLQSRVDAIQASINALKQIKLKNGRY
jgi:hypothetical protein